MFKQNETSLTLDNVYLQHIIQMNGLSTRGYLNNRPGWQINVRNYIFAVDHLEAAVMGDLADDKKYIRRIKNLREYAKLALRKHEKENTTNKVRRNDFGMQLSLEVAQKKLGIIMGALVQNGRIRNRTVSAVDDLPSGKVDPSHHINEFQMRDILTDLARAGQLPTDYLIPDEPPATTNPPAIYPDHLIYEDEDENDDYDLAVTPYYPERGEG